MDPTSGSRSPRSSAIARPLWTSSSSSASDGVRNRPTCALPESYTCPGVFKRFLLGAFVIVVASAAATAVAAWHAVDSVVAAFKGTAHITGISQVLDPAAAGTPQT